MQENDQGRRLAEDNRLRVQEWLGGHTAPVRVRGTARGTNRMPSDIDGLFRLLEQVRPQPGWVIVVDGRSTGPFATRFCDQTRKRRPRSSYWWVERNKEAPRASVASQPFPMKPLDLGSPATREFLGVNPVDLALVPLHPPETQLERVRHWVKHSMFVVVEGPSGLAPDSIASGTPRRYLAHTFEEASGALSAIL